MSQKIENNDEVQSQLNVGENKGTISFVKRTRFSKRFEKLNAEVASDQKYEGIIADLKFFRTKLDGKTMPIKLADGGFAENEIQNATVKYLKYARKLERSKFYESAQWIDSKLFAMIKFHFETYVEKPLINNNATKEEIQRAVAEKVIAPVLSLLNEEGENDDFLSYDSEDVYGMVYYLTGRCHLNWTNYDSL